MATRRYKISVGETEFNIIDEAGAAVNSDTVELTVDLSTSAVNATSGTRGILKEEVLDSLDMLRNHIIKNNWPPA